MLWLCSLLSLAAWDRVGGGKEGYGQAGSTAGETWSRRDSWGWAEMVPHLLSVFNSPVAAATWGADGLGQGFIATNGEEEIG